jgi:polyhydroxyalkanoate synthase
MVSSDDVTRLDRPGGHIGLMAGSRARNEIWPDIAKWLGERSVSKTTRRGSSNGNPRDS